MTAIFVISIQDGQQYLQVEGGTKLRFVLFSLQVYVFNGRVKAATLWFLVTPVIQESQQRDH